ncbi:ubiquitin family protein [Rhizobium leguminosarum]|uniref:hypothetical protein n=1 Tax=Rhizobium leguminosarum TaxID=384 RepID=UPI0015F9AA66|nr:hypothetical protein [Rhizobium leguminosarum]MBA9032852.1 hypothetical protein [Rhizobium leguminosarum]MDI5928424.1 hypothetical protein [Rhizobium leguminosarum]
MTSFSSEYVKETLSTVLISVFEAACARHDISPDSDDGVDLLIVLTHAFQKGTTTEERLLAFVMDLLRK